MGPQYQPEELLRLRESPLVSKPASLPPVEEWMGPLQEPAQKRISGARGKVEGSFGSDNNPRPSLIETRHISRASGNVPSDIVLGPPKTAFASASALKSPRQFDSPSRSAFGNFGGDSSRTDYFGQKGKGTGSERDSKDDKLGNNSSSKSKYDLDSSSGPRSARNFTSEEDGSSPRHGEREGNEAHGDPHDVRKATYRNQDAFRRDGDDNRRNGIGRSSRPSWFRDDDNPGTPREGYTDNVRNREWREGDRGMRRPVEREWSRNAKTEQDPEWMAEEKPKEKKERHTTEDIEQWKAAMRAQTKGVKEECNASDGAHHFRSTSGSTVSKTKLDTPLTTLDNGSDTFFNLWDRPKANSGLSEQNADGGLRPKNLRQPAPKSSRFTGFFSPQPSTEPKASDHLAVSVHNAPGNVPTAEESALHAYNAVFDENPNDDKAGFERMLQMLRSNPRSGIEEARQPQTPTEADRGPLGQELNSELQPHNPQSPKVLSPRSQRAHGFENLLGPQSPREPVPVYGKDSEYLLNLLRKDDSWKQAVPGLGKAPGTNAPGILPHPNVVAQYQPQCSSEENGQNDFAEDQSPEHSRPLDKLNPTASVARTQRPPGQFDDHEETGHFLPPFSMGNPNMPPGPQRPPGFDHAPPPGFSSFMSSQPQGQRGGPMAPPPGFPTPSRNPNPGHFPPGLAPRMAGLNLGGPERGPPNIGPMGPGSGPPGGPPAVGPFMGGPPPFVPPHSAGFPMMGGGGGGSGPFGNGPAGRPPMDLFSSGSGEFGANGGVPAGRGGGGGGLSTGPPLSGQFGRQD